ncbi:hypothetical protein DNTS_014844 [Danionella cerebrum]|uniref:Biogenesis of lysosome-related organelles complex 1 subunit 4 n=1 Tax=Danionella cerebrum TaxID=2873325 RepID=A0A553N246_9TELE|nr:hypothetical protein DNTS_014844 [Danionella translucida]
MEHRFDRAAVVLSPLEESSAEVSRDSGIVSQSASSLSMVSEALSSGTVSQSPSFGAAVAQSPSSATGETQEQTDSDQTQDEELLRRTAITFSSYVLCLEKSLEEMLTRVDEFVGMLDLIRNDTSQVVNENLPQIQRKSEEMREIYRKIDKLEAFVRMVGANVSGMEEQEALQPPLKPASPRRQPQRHQELPSVFRTEDYFKPQSEQ